jgi:hypothetical protein
MSEREHRGSRHTMVLTVALSTLTTLVIGSTLYYTLKRHDVLHAEAAQAAGRAGERQAMAVGQAVATAARSIILSDMSRLQDLIASLQRSEGMKDAMIVSRDNTVLAARHAAQVGQLMQDAAWAAWKSGNRAVVQRAVDQAGQPVLVVVEPLTDKGDVLAWAMLVFTAPDGGAAPRAPLDRMMEVGRLMAPIFLFLLISIGLAMKLATGVIRKQIQGVMADVLEEPAETGGEGWLRKVS